MCIICVSLKFYYLTVCIKCHSGYPLMNSKLRQSQQSAIEKLSEIPENLAYNLHMVFALKKDQITVIYFNKIN